MKAHHVRKVEEGRNARLTLKVLSPVLLKEPMLTSIIFVHCCVLFIIDWHLKQKRSGYRRVVRRGEEEEERITILQERKQCEADLEGVEPYLLEKRRRSRGRGTEEG